jgi:geranylgeranyl diphosphate synthase, type II
MLSSPATLLTKPGSFDLTNYLSEQREYIDLELERAIAVVHPKKLFESMKYSLLCGGKRLRPILCLAGCELAGGDRELAIATACAIEMLHTASLIHDDLPAMDDDDVRRGRPSNHKVFGEGVALLAGDALLTYSLEFIITRTPRIPAERLLQVLHTLIRLIGVSGLVAGQIADLESEGALDVDLQTVEFIHSRKTASLVEAAVVTGAQLAGAEEDMVSRLARYARNIGLAFQIIDDILDVTATQEALGKTPNKDQTARKATYPRLLGLAESRRRASQLIAAAKLELAPFGDRADPLIAVANFIEMRPS